MIWAEAMRQTRPRQAGLALDFVAQSELLVAPCCSTHRLLLFALLPLLRVAPFPLVLVKDHVGVFVALHVNRRRAQRALNREPVLAFRVRARVGDVGSMLQAEGLAAAVALKGEKVALHTCADGAHRA